MTSSAVDFRTVLSGLLSILLLAAASVPARADDPEAREEVAESEVLSASGAGAVSGGEADVQNAGSVGSPAFEQVQRIMDESAGLGENGAGGTDGAGTEGGWLGPDWTLFLWLGFIVLLIIGSGWALRRFVAGRTGNVGGQIRVVASCALSPRSRLFIVEVGGERFLIGEAGGNVSLISSLISSPSPDQVPIVVPDQPADAPAPTFADRLRQWEQSVSGRSASGEVRTSLRVLEALTRRLRRGAATTSGGSEGT